MSAVAKPSAKPAVTGIYNNFLDYLFCLKVLMSFSLFLAFHSLFLKHDYQRQAGLSHTLFNTITETNDPIHSLISNFFFSGIQTWQD